MRRMLLFLRLTLIVGVIVGLVVSAGPSTAALPGANGKIAFTSDRDSPGCGLPCREVYVMNADGTGLTQLTNTEGRNIFPSWSPDGTKIAFCSVRDGGNLELYTMNADGSGQTRLTSNTAYDCIQSWSPDGQKIVFTSNRDGNFEIYVMDADGSNQTRLTSNPAAENTFHSNWSPNGKKILFNSDRDGNSEIYVMNADGSSQTRLTFNPALDYPTSWSPDGGQILFSSDRDFPGCGSTFPCTDLYVMNAQGKGTKRLTSYPEFDDDADWSPAGDRVVFDRCLTGCDESLPLIDMNSDIFVMKINGKGVTNLTNNPALDLHPAWQPLP